MTIGHGDYKWVEEQVVAVLLADTGAGGLAETGSPAVSHVAASDHSAITLMGQDRFPAALVRASYKRETPAYPSFSVTKTFGVSVLAADRSMDRAGSEDIVRKIAARIERVLRDQTATDKQFAGLPDLIDGAEGVLVCNLAETRFEETRAGENDVYALARIDAEIEVPCLYRFD